jgi:ribosomal protein L37AE/L43A
MMGCEHSFSRMGDGAWQCDRCGRYWASGSQWAPGILWASGAKTEAEKRPKPLTQDELLEIRESLVRDLADLGT